MYNLLNEYKELLNREVSIQTELSHLAKGYISKKTINGKQYCYLQCKTNGNVSSEYLKADDVERIRAELTLRKEYEAELPAILIRLDELEKAAKLIGKGMDRSLMLLKISAGMDEMDQTNKKKCISFASAMNAIEGVPASKQTTDDLIEWQSGTKSYFAVFAATLKRYGFAVEV